RKNDVQLAEDERMKEEFVNASLGGLQGKGTIVAPGKGEKYHVFADLAKLGKDVEAVGRAVAHAIQVEKNGVEIGELQGGFDVALRRGQRGAELREELAHVAEQFRVIGDDGQGVAFRVESKFGQAARFRDWRNYSGAGAKAKVENDRV